MTTITDKYIESELPTWWRRYGSGVGEFLPVAEQWTTRGALVGLNPTSDDLTWKLRAQNERWEFNPLGLIPSIVNNKGGIDTPRFHIKWNKLTTELATDPNTTITLQPNEVGDPVLVTFFKAGSPDAERSQRIINSICMILLKGVCMIDDLRGDWVPRYEQLKVTLRIEIRFKQRQEMLDTDTRLASEFDRWYFFPNDIRESKGRSLLQALRGWVLTGSKEIGGNPFYFGWDQNPFQEKQPWVFALESRTGREDFGTITWS